VIDNDNPNGRKYSEAMRVLQSSIIYKNPLPQLRALNSCFPFLCERDDGILLACHQMGQAFESVDGTSCISVSKDGGETWDHPYRMFDKCFDMPTSDGCKITSLGSGRLIAVGYEFFRENSDMPIGNPETGGLLDDRVFYSISEDGGDTWSCRQEIRCSWGNHVEASAPLTVLKDGSWALPITGFPCWDGSVSGKLCGRLLRSCDQGATWNDDVICMDFGEKDILCYEMRMCQTENGLISIIGWNENHKTGERLNNHYTISIDNGQSFSAPIDTGIHGQASSLCAIGGNRILALHAVRRDVDRPGIYGYIVDMADGKYRIVDEKLLWEPKHQMAENKNMASIFSYLRFGQPGAILLKDKDVLMSHWVEENGQYMSICTRIDLRN
jgi:sialidase-1